MKKNNSLNKTVKLIQKNIVSFSLGVLTVFLFFAVSITLLVVFYKPNQVENTTSKKVIITISPTVPVRKHIVAQGETLFLIAEKYYGDGKLMNKIIEANHIVNPDRIEIGTTLIIPNK